jgi:hypothetical protein
LRDHGCQPAVAGGLRNGDVQGLICFEKARDALDVGRLIAMTAGFIEHAEALGIDFAGCHVRRCRLQHQAQFEYVLDIFQRDWHHHVTAARYCPQQSIVSESNQRHAHRRLAETIVRA